MEKLTNDLPRPLLLDDLPNDQRVRFVHISDTHTHHWQMKLPAGDVLVHTGDLLGNYGYEFEKLERQYDDVVEWLESVAGRYDLVLIVPGNHDSVLDKRKRAKNKAKRRVGNLPPLPPNVKILDGEGLIYRGLNIWGEPHLTCRKEILNKNYYSNAFELDSSLRKKKMDNIPARLHLLLTHSPPLDGGLCGGSGDELLSERLREMRNPPLFHCFGHYHQPGVRWDGKTISMNGAQESYLGLSSKVTGFPWVFDVALEKC